jgi:gluconate 2-dehydrogenase gamma chain
MSEAEGSVSRRDFIVGSAALWIQATIPRPLAAAEAETDLRPRTLGQSEWQLVEAITARIIPTDDAPGAVEAGCVNFIDKALANEDASALPLYQAALRELDRVCQEGLESSFVDLAPADQDRILSELETGVLADWRLEDARPEAFFETLRMHTILGFVLDPRYGGNRDYVGWKTMGFPGPVHHLGGSRPEQMIGEQPFVPIWARAPDGSGTKDH